MRVWARRAAEEAGKVFAEGLTGKRKNRAFSVVRGTPEARPGSSPGTAEEVAALERINPAILAAIEAEAMPKSEGDDKARHRRRLQEMARIADSLKGELDAKLAGAIGIVSSLLKDGYQPIVFCRFIQTAEYVAAALRSSNKIPRGTEVVCVTGELAPAEREDRIGALAEFPRRILVATDCLSEGINLQRDFDAVVHYDLSWNPTRHEQREGRVDRYGQPSPKVRVVTYYGEDTGVDRIILRVLLRKHKTIRSSLGISVPVPARAEELVEAIFEDVLLHKRPKDNRQMLLEFGSDEAEPAGSPAERYRKNGRTQPSVKPAHARCSPRRRSSSGKWHRKWTRFEPPWLRCGRRRFLSGCTSALQGVHYRCWVWHQGAHRGQPPGCSSCCSRLATDSR